MDIDAHYGTAHPKKCSNINLDKKTLRHTIQKHFIQKNVIQKKKAGTFLDNVNVYSSANCPTGGHAVVPPVGQNVLGTF